MTGAQASPKPNILASPLTLYHASVSSAVAEAAAEMTGVKRAMKNDAA